MKTLSILSLYILLGLLIYLFNEPCYVQEGYASLAPREIKRAMEKMGPLKDYRLLPGGRLEVRVEGKWLRLCY